MLKHRGFPGRLPGTDFQFTVRRANPKGATELTVRERRSDRRAPDRRADEGFFKALWEAFGDEPFERGNLDAGRLSWLFGREVIPATDPFDPADYEAMLKIDLRVARQTFPKIVDEE
nr:hypothetical protein [Sulfitobacter guttiformis]